VELKTLEFSSLYFPRTEWKWLRSGFALYTAAPDSFVWAARVGDQLWAWHPHGGVPTLSDGSADSTKVRVLLLQTGGSEIEAFGLCLKTTFQVQPALDVEWVSALDVLEHRFKHDVVERGLPVHWAEAIKACGLEPHLGILAQRRRFVFLSDEERTLLFEKRWELATLELIETLPTELRPVFVEAIRRWNVSSQQTKEALNLVLILQRKFGEKTTRTVLENKFKSTDEFRTGLMSTAQPELAALSQKRIERLRGLRLPPRTAIFSDPSFEKDILKLTHNPRHIGDFEAFKSWVADEDVTRKMKELLEIYQ